jgi:uncharacterized protein YndB with AHSA1/START domain
MNLFLKAAVVTLVIVAIPLIIALFIKKDYTIERTVVVDKPKETVFNYIRFLRNQDHYSKWVMTDPAMRKSFRGIDGETGFVYAWHGNKQAGKGEQEIKGIREGERLDVEVRFEKPFKNVARTPMITQATGNNATLVTWRMEGHNSYPMNLMNLFLPGMLGKDMEQSLHTLKGILESERASAQVAR